MSHDCAVPGQAPERRIFLHGLERVSRQDGTSRRSVNVRLSSMRPVDTAAHPRRARPPSGPRRAAARRTRGAGRTASRDTECRPERGTRSLPISTSMHSHSNGSNMACSARADGRRSTFRFQNGAALRLLPATVFGQPARAINIGKLRMRWNFRDAPTPPARRPSPSRAGAGAQRPLLHRQQKHPRQREAGRGGGEDPAEVALERAASWPAAASDSSVTPLAPAPPNRNAP